MANDDDHNEDFYEVTRPVFSEKALTEHCLISTNELTSHGQLSSRERIKTILESVVNNCRCHGSKMDWLRKGLPIVDWLPKYSFKQDVFADLCAGITLGVMHIPQGLAFAMLASLPPVTGLYTSLIPVIIYMFLGTSRYLSQGAFPVVCMMVAEVVNREVSKMSGYETKAYNNATTDSTLLESVWSPVEAKKVQIAVSLAFLVGVIQAGMGFLRLGAITRFLSDPVVSGFTTGAAVVIITSQINPIFGLNIPRYSGLFSTVMTILSMLTTITNSNVGSLITGMLCIAILIGLKCLNERYSKKLPFPLPAELLVVVLSTGISYGGQLHSRFDVQIVKDIPKGMPPISIPSFDLMSNLVSDAFKIAIVIFATNISVAKLFAKRKKQKIDSNQELIAYGVCNVVVSFFSGFPASVAIARVVVQANLAQTQLCSVPVIAVLILVLLFIAHLFFYLPKAVLAAIVIANLLGLLKQFARVKDLWVICKTDAIVWCITCFGVILLGIDIGLGCGIFAALMCIILLSSKPKYSILGNIPNTDIYRDIKSNAMAKELYGVKIVRFESFLYYANVEYFRDVLRSINREDSSINHESLVPATADAHSTGDVSNDNGKHLCQENSLSERNDNDKKSFVVQVLSPIHSVIIDASTFTFIDSMGVEALRSIAQEFILSGVELYLANCSRYLQKKLQQSAGVMGDHQIKVFVSVHDAVLHHRLVKTKQMIETRC